MANTQYAGESFRPHWTGASSTVDAHLELYDGDVQTQFLYDSIFRRFTTFKSAQNQSNTWRGDRLGSVDVKGRKYGEKLENQSIRSEKFVVVVDTVSYVRVPVDFQDDWTAPDFRAEKTRTIGTQHAKAFDQAHLIQLIKSGDFTAPEHLKPAFNDGIVEEVTLGGTDLEADAEALQQAHATILATLIKRDQGTGSLVTLISPDWFNILLNHKKLMNVEFTGGRGVNDFAMRRIGYLNGVAIIETPRFPEVGVAITDHILGADFNITATQANRQMVLFDPSLALVTVEAKTMTVDYWEDKENFTNVLDSYHMYTVGQRRPDAVAVVELAAAGG